MIIQLEKNVFAQRILSLRSQITQLQDIIMWLKVTYELMKPVCHNENIYDYQASHNENISGIPLRHGSVTFIDVVARMSAHCSVLRQARLVQTSAAPEPKAGHSSLNFTANSHYLPFLRTNLEVLHCVRAGIWVAGLVVDAAHRVVGGGVVQPSSCGHLLCGCWVTWGEVLVVIAGRVLALRHPWVL